MTRDPLRSPSLAPTLLVSLAGVLSVSVVRAQDAGTPELPRQPPCVEEVHVDPSDLAMPGESIGPWSDLEDYRTCHIDLRPGRPLLGAQCSLLFTGEADERTLRGKCNGGDGEKAALTIRTPEVTAGAGLFSFDGKTADGTVRIVLPEGVTRQFSRIVYEGTNGYAESKSMGDNEFLVAGGFASDVQVFAEAADDSWHLLTLGKLDLPTHCNEGQRVLDALAALPRDQVPPWCEALRTRINGSGREEHETVCYDTTTGRVLPLALPKHSLINPNRGVLVVVRHCSDTAVTIEMDGEQGLSLPGINNQRLLGNDDSKGTSLEAVTQSEAMSKEPNTILVTARVFGPRKPGAADLSVTAGRNTPPLVQRLNTVKKTQGALRIGLAAVFGEDAVPPEYKAVQPAGSDTQIITQSGGGTGAFELVLGVAPYLFDVVAWGGRSYENRNNAYVAPFFGFGLASASTTSGFEAFTSVHAGLEFEFIPQLSLAGTFVMRRVTRLAGGLEPGSPVQGEGFSTRQDLGFGGALVLNASAEFFQFGVDADGASDEDEDEKGAGSPSEEKP